ncbi:hypothetical protein [Heyndrickxia vini]|uniref:Uncharacterized protein n=1 Tax=Heyndrickxia vini TaxID=1476025 RepID=A0ABX7E3L4_9BACI|nr:hypothetical protein [Heyndrickxia vini]QQZ09836.1 hypothetical protein I5776_02330 [Heyndrickxia vini]
MELFSSRLTIQSINFCEHVIPTPLGAITFDIIINQIFLSEADCSRQYYRLSNGGIAIQYRHSDFIAELVFCEPTIHLPFPFYLDKAVGAVWRVKSLTEKMNCEFITHLQPNHPYEIETGPDSGECLDAITLENKKYKLTLGTQDGVALAARAKKKDRIPDRFPSTDDIALYGLVNYITNGLTVPLPPLTQDEICQVHFVTAWKPNNNDEDATTWFAVDLTGEDILLKEGLY